MLTWRAVLCGLATAVAATACVPFRGEPVPPIAVVRGDSTVDVLYRRCGGELVKSIGVRRVDATRGGVVSGPTLWKVVSSTGSVAERFTVGKAPHGFETTVPLNGSLPADRELAITVETSDFEGTVDVRLSDARPGLAYIDGENLDLEEFNSRTDC